MTGTSPDLVALTETERLALARTEVLGRRAGLRQPEGYWHRGVWLPSEREQRSCCRPHTSPTNQPRSLVTFPDSARRHCLGVDHVARLFDVSPTALRRALKKTA